MITRREMTAALAASLATLLSGNPAALLAEPSASRQNVKDGKPSANRRRVPTLMQQRVGDIRDAEVTMLILDIPPHPAAGPHRSFPMHKHSGPVFAYVLEGRVENQVDPGDLKTYKAGDCWYEPAMHVHRLLRNLSDTQPAKILVFEVLPKGKPAGYLYPSGRPIFQR